MALTAEDLHNIKHLFDDRFDNIDAKFEKIDMRFEATDRRFDGIDSRLDSHDARFAAIRGDIDDLALATARQFDEVLGVLGKLSEDLSQLPL